MQQSSEFSDQICVLFSSFFAADTWQKLHDHSYSPDVFFYGTFQQMQELLKGISLTQKSYRN